MSSSFSVRRNSYGEQRQMVWRHPVFTDIFAGDYSDVKFREEGDLMGLDGLISGLELVLGGMKDAVLSGEQYFTSGKGESGNNKKTEAIQFAVDALGDTLGCIKSLPLEDLQNQNQKNKFFQIIEVLVDKLRFMKPGKFLIAPAGWFKGGGGKRFWG